jgi:hypothetical protein
MKNNDAIVQPDGHDEGKPDIVVVEKSDIDKEMARVAAIRARIDGIVRLPEMHAHDHSVAISIVLARLGMLVVMPDEFEEFTEEARMAVDTTRSALEQLRDTKRQREAEDQEREIQARAEAIAHAQRVIADKQQREAMLVIRNMQKMSRQQGNAGDIKLAIDAIAARSITEDEFGLGAGVVKMAQDTALLALRPRYEQAVIIEGAKKMRDAVNQEYGKLGDLADAVPEGHEPEDKLLTIIAYAYQIASALGAPAYILNVLADPENATNEQIDAMLPFAPEPKEPA